MKKHSFGQKKISVFDKIIQLYRNKKVAKKIPTGACVLDLGCGFDAQLLNSLDKKIKQGVGMDLSVNKSFVSPKIKLIEGRADAKLPFPRNSFDTVCALALIEHVNNPSILVEEAYRVLKENGSFYLTTPDLSAKFILEFLANKMHVIDRSEIRDHKQYFSAKSLSGLLQTSGFKKKNIQITKHVLGMLLFSQASK
jgi:ubiquinone/menaquinone biosynthesis C-methylase UbiE